MATVVVNNHTAGRIYVPTPIRRSVQAHRSIIVREVDESELARDYRGKITDLINNGSITIQIIANTPDVDDSVERRLIVSDNIMFTPEGGLAVRYLNDTGAPSIKGSVVEASPNIYDGVRLAVAGAANAVGVVYESGFLVGEPMFVVTSGKAQVLLEDGTTSTVGYWVGLSTTVNGRADATNAVAPGLVLRHFDEIGHCHETKGAGVNVLALCTLHFN